MALFLLIFLSLYGGLHLYLWAKVRQALAPPGPWQLLLVLWLALMIAGPVVGRVLDRPGTHSASVVVSWAAYIWMAVLFWFTVLLLALDLWRALMRLAASVRPEAAGLVPAPGKALAVVAVLVAVACLRGGWEAWDMRLEKVRVTSPLIPAGTPPLRVVQISDVHLGPVVGRRRLEAALKLVREADPDLVVSTGDLVDGSAAHLNDLSGLLAGLDPPLGKYAVTGNHEFYAGLQHSVDFHRAAGFRLLRGESVRVGPLELAGVDDPAVPQEGGGSREGALLPSGPRERFLLLLKHRPEVAPSSTGRFDLQLSGHTHQGQIFPFSFFIWLSGGRLSGDYDFAGGARLRVSRGTGTWGPPMRLLAPPEVTLVEIGPPPG